MRRIQRSAVLVAGMLLVVAACTSEPEPKPAADSPQRGGVLELLGPGGVDHLDSASANYAVSSQVQRLYTRQLFAYPAVPESKGDPRAAFVPVPDIAAEIPTTGNGGISADLKTYTIKLRQGVRWDTSPAREVTAADFVRGFKRLCNPVVGSGGQYYTSTIQGMRQYCDDYQASVSAKATPAQLAAFQDGHDIAGVVAVGADTLRFTLVEPANDFLDLLVLRFASAAPVEVDKYLPDSEEYRKNLISNGPYKLTTYVKDREYRFDRNPAWSQDSDQVRHQYVDAVHIDQRDVSTDSVREKMQANQADLAWAMPTLGWASEEDASERPAAGQSLNPYMIFNFQSRNDSGSVRNRLVRQAISFAVDKQAVSKVVPDDFAYTVPAHTSIPPGSVGHVEFDLYPSPNDRGDVNRCRQLMTQAGRTAGAMVKIAHRNVGFHPNVAKAVAASLARCGIRSKLQGYPQSAFYGDLLQSPARGASGEWDIAIGGWTPDWFGQNGRTFVQPLFGTGCVSGTSNYGCYSNPAVDALITRALRVPEQKQAADLWHQADVAVLKDAAIVPLLHQTLTMARQHSSRVRNAIILPSIQWFDLTHVWIAQS